MTMDVFERLGAFMCRARLLEVGRDRLFQVRHRLQLLLVTEDASENTLMEMVQGFDCPVFCALQMSDIERLFGYRGTKVIGFRRHPLSNQVLEALKECRVVRRRALPERPRVAVLGASGIGRHHANWWNMEGGEVVAFLGSSEQSVAETQAALSAQFGFAGKGYCDLATLLRDVRPDVVDICLPPAMHYEACRASLSAGCHVLCEKPFVFDAQLGGAELRRHGVELVRLARRQGLQLGVCTQYAVAAREVLRLWRQSHPGEKLTSFSGRIVSPSRGRSEQPWRTWVDLAPHLLGACQVLSAGGELVPESIQRHCDGHLAEVDFSCCGREGTLACHIEVSHTDVEPFNVRQLSLNGTLYDIGGVRDEHGVFQMTLTTAAGTVESPDMMRLLIRSFMQGKIAVPPSMALRNLSLLLATLGWPENSADAEQSLPQQCRLWED